MKKILGVISAGLAALGAYLWYTTETVVFVINGECLGIRMDVEEKLTGETFMRGTEYQDILLNDLNYFVIIGLILIGLGVLLALFNRKIAIPAIIFGFLLLAVAPYITDVVGYTKEGKTLISQFRTFRVKVGWKNTVKSLLPFGLGIGSLVCCFYED